MQCLRLNVMNETLKYDPGCGSWKYCNVPPLSRIWYLCLFLPTQGSSMGFSQVSLVARDNMKGSLLDSNENYFLYFYPEFYETTIYHHWRHWIYDQWIFNRYRPIQGQLSTFKYIVHIPAKKRKTGVCVVSTKYERCVQILGCTRHLQTCGKHWNRLSILTHWGRDKWSPFSRRYFQMRFREWKCMNFE